MAPPLELLAEDRESWGGVGGTPSTTGPTGVGKSPTGVQFLHGLASWFISHSVELILLLGQGTPESTGPEATLCLADPPSAVGTP